MKGEAHSGAGRQTPGGSLLWPLLSLSLEVEERRLRRRAQSEQWIHFLRIYFRGVEMEDLPRENVESLRNKKKTASEFGNQWSRDLLWVDEYESFLPCFSRGRSADGALEAD